MSTAEPPTDPTVARDAPPRPGEAPAAAEPTAGTATTKPTGGTAAPEPAAEAAEPTSARVAAQPAAEVQAEEAAAPEPSTGTAATPAGEPTTPEPTTTAPATDAVDTPGETPATSAAESIAPASTAAPAGDAPSDPADAPAVPSPAPEAAQSPAVDADPAPARSPETPADELPPSRSRGERRPMSPGSLLIAVLLALFGFVLVVQLRSATVDEGLGAARQEDLVRILSDLQAREQRLNDDIAALDATRQQLASGVEGRQAAMAEAERRANELGLLAGTLPARGPGLRITVVGAEGKPVRAAAMLNAVQELRGAGSEVIQLSGAGGTAVRVTASTAFVDDGNGLVVDRTRLSGPYELTVIGSPKILVPALNIAGGAVAGFERDGGTVNIVELDSVEVTATREPADLKYARPVS